MNFKKMENLATISSEKSPIYQSEQIQFAPTGLNTNETTWAERLLLNLFSYSLILFPIAVIVFATRFKLLPASLQNSVLVQWFVYGSNCSTTNRLIKLKNINTADSDSTRTLLSEENLTPKRAQETTKSVESSTSSTLTLLWCFSGLQLSYLIWGVLQEKIMTTKYEVSSNLHLQSDNMESKTITFHDSQFLVFVNRIIAFILSIIALVYNRPRRTSNLYPTSKYTTSLASQSQNLDHQKPQAPLYEYIYCSLSNILSSWCQYEALKFVNFPTQVLSKSCKIIPVMLMSKLMLKKKYKSFDYLCALFLSLGMFIFLLYQPVMSTKTHSNSSSNSNESTSGEASSSANNSSKQSFADKSLMSGLIILALYLLFDSFTSNWQQSLFTRYGVSNWQMMAATNFYSILLTLTSLHQLGTLKPAFELIGSSKLLLLDCVLMSVMSSIGQLFVYYTIKRFGSVVFAVIMTLRQFLAILLSCTIYGHRLTLGSTAGLLLVFIVVAYQMWSKSGGQSNNNNNKTKLSGGGFLSVQEQQRIKFNTVSVVK